MEEPQDWGYTAYPFITGQWQSPNNDTQHNPTWGEEDLDKGI